MRYATAVLCLTATPAMAQNPNCADREQVVARLAEQYGETLQSAGMNNDNAVLEIYASEDTGTWTILVTRPDGVACLIAAGEMWEGDAAPLTKPGEPS
jgi:Rad3-related DNA helicase